MTPSHSRSVVSAYTGLHKAFHHRRYFAKGHAFREGVWQVNKLFPFQEMGKSAQCLSISLSQVVFESGVTGMENPWLT